PWQIPGALEAGGGRMEAPPRLLELGRAGPPQVTPVESGRARHPSVMALSGQEESDDTDARNDIPGCFGRSHRRAQRHAWLLRSITPTYAADRRAAAAPGSRSVAEVVGRRLQAVVRRGMCERLCADAWHHLHRPRRSAYPQRSAPISAQHRRWT